MLSNKNREFKEMERKQLASNDAFRIAKQLELEDEQNENKNKNKAVELDLSNITDEEEREKRRKENNGHFVSFKEYMNTKVNNQQEDKDDEVNLRESKPEIEKESPKIKQNTQEETKQSKNNKFEPSLEVIDEEPNFENRNRSFPRHPLDESHDSKIEEESIRMSKSTLRQIKSK